MFYAKEGPCYRCLFPEPPPPGLVPSCAEGGVLGVLPGTIGTMQATEAIKLHPGHRRAAGRPAAAVSMRSGMTLDEVSCARTRTASMCSDHPTMTN